MQVGAPIAGGGTDERGAALLRIDPNLPLRYAVLVNCHGNSTYRRDLVRKSLSILHAHPMCIPHTHPIMQAVTLVSETTNLPHPILTP